MLLFYSKAKSANYSIFKWNIYILSTVAVKDKITSIAKEHFTELIGCIKPLISLVAVYVLKLI